METSLRKFWSWISAFLTACTARDREAGHFFFGKRLAVSHCANFKDDENFLYFLCFLPLNALVLLRLQCSLVMSASLLLCLDSVSF